MLQSDAITRTELLRGSSEGVGVDPEAPAGGHVDLERLRKLSLARLTDRQLTWLLGAVLFVVGAWPLALTEVPPYQDLPNHLATLTVIENLSSYPEYVFNG